MSTLKVSALQGSSASTPAFTLDNAGAAAAVLSSVNGGPISGARNRIINGDMRIDQRNNGASVANSGNYNLDRWADGKVGSGIYSAQRSTVAPSGFTNSFLHTVATAVTPAATDVYQFYQVIEGFNTADLGFGAAGASTITVSFWVRSSIAGTYGMSVGNGALNRSYVQTYAISTANTWEYKTITIPGDTTGTWPTDNTAGMILIFDQGSGSNANGAAGAWQAGIFRRTSGCVNLIATAGATWQVTGVQLERGPVATPFERRSYGQELALCQRYYEVLTGPRIVTSAKTSISDYVSWTFKVTKRASPTVALGAGSSASATDSFGVDGYTAISPTNTAGVIASGSTASIEL